IHKLHSAIMRGMSMTDKQIHEVPTEILAEGRHLIPSMETHQSTEHTKLFISEEKTTHLGPREHLFLLPVNINARDIINAHISFFIRP
ncbi:hypothetical protein PENTCL1PPCAC_21486, partial [Pristionchus entomophagus]